MKDADWTLQGHPKTLNGPAIEARMLFAKSSRARPPLQASSRLCGVVTTEMVELCTSVFGLFTGLPGFQDWFYSFRCRAIKAELLLKPWKRELLFSIKQILTELQHSPEP